MTRRHHGSTQASASSPDFRRLFNGIHRACLARPRDAGGNDGADRPLLRYRSRGFGLGFGVGEGEAFALRLGTSGGLPCLILSSVAFTTDRRCSGVIGMIISPFR